MSHAEEIKLYAEAAEHYARAALIEKQTRWYVPFGVFSAGSVFTLVLVALVKWGLGQ